MTVEACHQISHGRPAAQASLPRGMDQGFALSDRQQGGRSPYVVDAFAAALDDAL
jgi:hypothetical protein